MRVTSLHHYPIKGCRGHSMGTVQIDPLGVVDDRRLMLVDDKGLFLSQRVDPVLATITPTLIGRSMIVSTPSQQPISLELSPGGTTVAVSIWRDTVSAVDQGDEIASWFSAVVGRAVRLVWFTGSSRRMLDPQFSPRPEAQTAFTDGYPLLFVTEESLADLNQQLVEPIGMDRFRPNVVVAGSDPWSEDDWQAVAIGQMLFDVVKPCARCLVPTTNQVTGEQSSLQEPLRTLATFRTRKPFGAIFGQNVVPRSTGTIKVGDELTLQETES